MPAAPQVFLEFTDFILSTHSWHVEGSSALPVTQSCLARNRNHLESSKTKNSGLGFGKRRQNREKKLLKEEKTWLRHLASLYKLLHNCFRNYFHLFLQASLFSRVHTKYPTWCHLPIISHFLEKKIPQHYFGPTLSLIAQELYLLPCPKCSWEDAVQRSPLRLLVNSLQEEWQHFSALELAASISLLWPPWLFSPICWGHVAVSLGAWLCVCR